MSAVIIITICPCIASYGRSMYSSAWGGGLFVILFVLGSLVYSQSLLTIFCSLFTWGPPAEVLWIIQWVQVFKHGPYMEGYTMWTVLITTDYPLHLYSGRGSLPCSCPWGILLRMESAYIFIRSIIWWLSGGWAMDGRLWWWIIWAIVANLSIVMITIQRLKAFFYSNLGFFGGYHVHGSK